MISVLFQGPCFGLLMTFVLGSKARMEPLTCVLCRLFVWIINFYVLVFMVWADWPSITYHFTNMSTTQKVMFLKQPALQLFNELNKFVQFASNTYGEICLLFPWYECISVCKNERNKFLPVKINFRQTACCHQCKCTHLTIQKWYFIGIFTDTCGQKIQCHEFTVYRRSDQCIFFYFLEEKWFLRISLQDAISHRR